MFNDKRGLIFTNENCISCNKRVRVCTSPGASYGQTDGVSSVVHICPERCIACDACFAMCDHNARDCRDDADAFFHDLESGEPISLLLAQAFRASCPEEYGTILGELKGSRRPANHIRGFWRGHYLATGKKGRS